MKKITFVALTILFGFYLGKVLQPANVGCECVFGKTIKFDRCDSRKSIEKKAANTFFSLPEQIQIPAKEKQIQNFRVNFYCTKKIRNLLCSSPITKITSQINACGVNFKEYPKDYYIYRLRQIII